MKKRLLIAFLICLVIFAGIKIYRNLHLGIDASSLKKTDGFSIWRAKDKNGRQHFIFEYCRFDDEKIGDTKILHCKILGH